MERRLAQYCGFALGLSGFVGLGGASGCDLGDSKIGMNGGTEGGSGSDGDTGEIEPSTGGDSGTAGPFEEAEICDGSGSVRLAARTLGGGMLESGLLAEVGFSYLFITGDCQFWQNGGLGAITRVGQLTPSQAQQLSQDLRYGAWSVLAGEYGDLGNVPDASSLVFEDGSNRISCVAGCLSEFIEAPAQLGEVQLGYETWSTTLESEGDDAAGDLRIDVVAIEGLRQADIALSWPSAVVLADVARPAGTRTTGPSTLIEDADDRAALQAIRNQFVSGPVEGGGPSQFQFGDYVFEQDGALFQVWIRDALPFENDDGHVEL